MRHRSEMKYAVIRRLPSDLAHQTINNNLSENPSEFPFHVQYESPVHLGPKLQASLTRKIAIVAQTVAALLRERGRPV